MSQKPQWCEAHPPGSTRVINLIHKALLSHALTCLWLLPHPMLLTMFSTSMPISRSSWSAVLESSQNEQNVCAGYSCLNSSPETNAIFIIIIIICSSYCVPGASQVSTLPFPLLIGVWFVIGKGDRKPLQSRLHKLGLWACARTHTNSVFVPFMFMDRKTAVRGHSRRVMSCQAERVSGITCAGFNKVRVNMRTCRNRVHSSFFLRQDSDLNKLRHKSTLPVPGNYRKKVKWSMNKLQSHGTLPFSSGEKNASI